MLNFDSLAAERAKALNQEEQVWKRAVWAPSFQAISQSMSDGEVESFIALFSSVPTFELAVSKLEERLRDQAMSPHSLIAQEAAAAGLTPDDWVRSLAKDAP